MDNPTPQECAALTKKFDEFRWHDFYGLEWNHGEQKVELRRDGSFCLRWYGKGPRGHEVGRTLQIDRSIGLAALTAKCKEVARANGICIYETTIGEWAWLIDDTGSIRVRPNFDTPWAALLATKTEVAPDGD